MLNFKLLCFCPFIINASIINAQRRNVHAWDAKSDKPTFRTESRLKLELPRGTVLETELVVECEGEVQ